MNKLSNWLLATCFTVFLSQGYAQVTYAEFREQSDLTIKSEMGLELWNYYIRQDLDSLKIAAVDLLLLASEKKHEFARAAGTRMMGSYLYRTGKIEQGLEYLNMAKGFFEKKEDFMIASEIYNEIGHAYLLKADYAKAKQAYNTSLNFGKQSTDDTDAYNGKLGLGRTYIATGDTNAGMVILHSYKQNALASRRFEAVADVYAHMAMVESDRGNSDVSFEYYLESFKYSQKAKSKVYRANGYANWGILKFEIGEYDSSLYYFKESLRLRKEVNSIRPLVEGYNNLAFFYQERDSIPQCLENYRKAIDLAMEYKLLQDELDMRRELVSVYTEMGQEEMASDCELRIADLEKKIEQGNQDEDEQLNNINLDFEKNAGDKKAEKGLGWVTFIIIAVASLLLVFFFLERKRFLP